MLMITAKNAAIGALVIALGLGTVGMVYKMRSAQQNASSLLPKATDEASAIFQIELLGGKVTRDDKQPDFPVIAIQFQNGASFGDSNLYLLKFFPRLATLDLPGTEVTDVGMSQVAELSSLEHLDISRNSISDIGVAPLAELKQLTQLNLRGAAVTDAGLKTLGQLHNLTSLNLMLCEQISDAGLHELRELRNLRALNLLHTQITATGVKQLGGLEQLTVEYFNDHQLTDADVAKLSACPVNPDEALNESAAIEKIKLLGGNVSRNETLPDHPARIIGFRNPNKFNDNCMHLLKPCQHLEVLRLIGSQITDAGVKELGEFRRLNEIYLGYTQITDASLRELGKREILRKIGLRECPEITEAGVEQLRKALPNVQIIR